MCSWNCSWTYQCRYICINYAEITKDDVMSIDICSNCAEITKDDVTTFLVGVSTLYLFRSWCPIQSWSVASLQLLSRLSCTKGWVEMNQRWNILLMSAVKCKMKLMVLPVVREARCEGLAQWVLHLAASCWRSSCVDASLLVYVY